jgi:hypothetical protein
MTRGIVPPALIDERFSLALITLSGPRPCFQRPSSASDPRLQKPQQITAPRDMRSIA